jgi:BirA family biotin operon repressor/biotin-[acetyl-CoA-carboxylase] ligase
MISGPLAGAPMSPFDLLAKLADGRFHSGQDLADQHEVSRTAIWKQIASLQELGLEIERVRGQGYRIPGGVDLLHAPTIYAGLEPRARDLAQRPCDQSRSILQMPNCSAVTRRSPVRCRMSCRSQSAGRGRRGRSWVSPFASSIYLSAAWQFEGGAEVLEGLSLAVGVALGEAITALGAPGVRLKWPNDLLLDGGKAAGILVELSGDLSGPCTAIIGIGVNVRLPAGQAEVIDQPWTDLQSAVGAPVSRNALVAEILNRLLPLVDDYEAGGFGAWAERWEALHAHAGAEVAVEQAGKQLIGTVIGVDARGALMLQTESGVQALRGGEVSLRPVSGPVSEPAPGAAK